MQLTKSLLVVTSLIKPLQIILYILVRTIHYCINFKCLVSRTLQFNFWSTSSIVIRNDNFCFCFVKMYIFCLFITKHCSDDVFFYGCQERFSLFIEFIFIKFFTISSKKTGVYTKFIVDIRSWLGRYIFYCFSALKLMQAT